MATPLLSSETLARFAVTARLGAAVARPFALLHSEARGLDPLPPEATGALAGARAFAAPLERALSRARGVGASLALPAEAIDAAAGMPEGRLAMLLASEPSGTVEKAALQSAAAAMQKQILGVMLKSERQRVRALIGPENFIVATQEAPTLHPGLAALGSNAYFGEALAAPDTQAQRRLVGYGLKLLAEFVGATQAPFAALFLSRLPSAAAGVKTGAPMAPLARPFLKFIRRRMPEWSAIIG